MRNDKTFINPERYRAISLGLGVDLNTLHKRLITPGKNVLDEEKLLHMKNWHAEGMPEFAVGVRYVETEKREKITKETEYLKRLAQTLTSKQHNLLTAVNPLIKSEKLIKVDPASDVEYRNDRMQVVVAAIVTDFDDNIVLLRDHSESRHTGCVTLVQGHVSYDESIFTQTANDYLYDQILRELYEEIGFTEDDDIFGGYPVAIFYDNTNLVSLEHIIVVFNFVVANTKKFVATNNEKHKHDVMAINIEKALDLENQDNLVKEVLSRLCMPK